MPNLVVYDFDQKRKVKEYDDLKKSEKCGSFWGAKGDKELTSLKKHIKDFYILNQGYKCVYCRQKIVVKHNSSWDAEHIIPKNTHPQFLFKPENLCISCKDCNGAKLDKNVLVNPSRQSFCYDKEAYIIVHPHFDVYDEHIKVVSDSLMFLPRSKKGLYTIESCGLLRFAYDFSNYGKVSLEIKQKVGVMHKELMDARTAMEEIYLLNLIEDIVKEGKRLAIANCTTNY